MDGWIDHDEVVSFLWFGSKYEKECRLRYKGYVDTPTTHSLSFWRDFYQSGIQWTTGTLAGGTHTEVLESKRVQTVPVRSLP